MRLTSLGTSCVLAVALAACGTGGRDNSTSDSSNSNGGASEAKAADHAEAEAAAKAKADRAKKQAAHDQCATLTRPLRNSLGQMNSRLAIGLNYGDYGKRLGDISVAYDRVAPNISAKTDSRCVNSAIKLENAMNEYIKVSNAWDKCFDDDYCQFEGEKLREAQRGWERAGVALARSQKVLDRMAP